jgi:hypothetical protein
MFELLGDNSLKLGLIKTLNKSMGSIDVGKQQMEHIHLGIPMYHSSRTFISINLYENNDTDYVLGRDQDPEVEVDAEGGQLPVKFSIMEHYASRGHLDNPLVAEMSFYNFASVFPARKDLELVSYEKRICPRIIPRISCVVDPEGVQLEAWSRQMCILHLPWYDSYQSLRSSDDEDEAWADVFVKNAERFPQKVLNVLELATLSFELNADEKEDACLEDEFDEAVDGDALDTDEERPEDANPEDWMLLAALKGQHAHRRGVDHRDVTDADFSKDYHLFSKAMPTVESWLENAKAIYQKPAADYSVYTVDSLTEGQRWLFFKVFSWEKQRLQSLMDGSTYPANIGIDLEGTAGSGKSYVIHTIIKYLEMIDPGSSIASAPTGVAASLIGGVTLHSDNHLPRAKQPFAPLQGNF